MPEDLPPQEMFRKRREIADHFQQKRKELERYKFGGISGTFAKGRLLSIISSYEKDAKEEAEKAHWKDLDKIFAKCDAEIAREMEPFISRMKLGGVE